MIEAPRIVQVEQLLTAAIRLTVPRGQIQEVMGPAIAEVMELVATQARNSPQAAPSPSYGPQ